MEAQREWALLLSAAMDLVMIGIEVFEVAIIDRYAQAIIPSTVVQQVLMLGFGLVIFGLASYLWMSEYREHHFPTRLLVTPEGSQERQQSCSHKSGGVFI